MKKKIHTKSRRKFLKMSAAGTAGLAFSSISCIKAPNRGGDDEADDPGPMIQRSEWSAKQAVNPYISNTKVAFCHDPEMVLPGAMPLFTTMEGQNDVIDKARVYENMDKMAAALAGTSTAAEAWAAIFQKPADKTWDQVRVALKQNCLESKNMARLAVIGKICEELHVLGVSYGNMTVFDWPKNDPCTSTYGSAYSKSMLPSPDIEVSDSLGGDSSTVELPDGTQEQCCSDLADGTADILINFAVNKGHGAYVGGYTVGMKNHIGSIKFRHPAEIQTPNKVIAINHSTQIMGTPAAPKQQLIVVDSLWAMRGGPGGTPNAATHCLLMGVHPVIVDYLTVRKVREAPKASAGGPAYGMGMTDTDQEILERYLSSYGYAIDSDEIRNLDVIDVSV